MNRPAGANGAKAPLRVLFFEDNADDVELSLLALQAAGFDVRPDVVETPEELVQRVCSKEYDIILSDYRMPGATGMEAFQALRSVEADIPFILLTGSLGDEKAVECLKQGVSDYVLKDRIVRLPVAIRRAIEERRLRADRARAEDALQKSERSYRSLVEGAPFGIFRSSAQQDRFLAVNPALVEMLGYGSEEEVLALKVSLDVYLDPEAGKELLQRCHERGSLMGVEVEWRRKDGTPITVRLGGRLLEDHGAACFEMVAENVTDRKRSEERISQLNRLYSVLTHVSEAIVRIRNRDELLREMCRIAVEEGCFRMAWVGMREPGSTWVKPLVHCGLSKGYLNRLVISIEDEPVGRGPAGRALRYGRHFIVQDTKTDPEFDPWRERALRCGYRSAGGFPLSIQGNTIGVIVLYAAQPGFFDRENVALLDELAADVSFALERMELAELSQRAMDELDQFFTLSLDMLAIADMDGHIHRLNPACERLLGFTAGELDPERIGELVHPEDRAKALAALRALQAGEEAGQLEIRLRSRRGESRWLLCNASPVERERLVFVTARDITERKNLEEQLRQQNLALEEQNRRVEAASRMKSGFLANMSHELRSPLNGIVGFTEILHDGKLGVLSERQSEILGRVLSSARHLVRLINGALDLSKIEAGCVEFQPEPVRLSLLVEEGTASLSALASEKHIRLNVEIDPAVDAVTADAGRLKQVLYNYLSNALKFTGDGGSITIKLEPEGEAAFRLSVSDTGVGIAEKDIPLLFVEFQQLDSGTAKRFQGTGLGLALTKRIVEAQGGSVGIESTRGQGSTFFAVLPRTPRQPRASSAATRILVAAADGVERSLLTQGLRTVGHQVQTAATCAETLSKCSEQTFDLITLDWQLRDGNGGDALLGIRATETNRDTPVILFSITREADLPVLQSMAECLKKPVRSSEPALLMRGGRPAG